MIQYLEKYIDSLLDRSVGTESKRKRRKKRKKIKLIIVDQKMYIRKKL